MMKKWEKKKKEGEERCKMGSNEAQKGGKEEDNTEFVKREKEWNLEKSGREEGRKKQKYWMVT